MTPGLWVWHGTLEKGPPPHAADAFSWRFPSILSANQQAPKRDPVIPNIRHKLTSSALLPAEPVSRLYLAFCSCITILLGGPTPAKGISLS